MYCLHCGDCCRRMSPLSEGRCPHLVEDSSFFFCGVYADRPEECARHELPGRFCPIGVEILNLESLDAVRIRIDTGWEKTKNINN